jgi:multiple sugar transport system permease protein/multiple sugar transport system substrate-binding protein
MNDMQFPRRGRIRAGLALALALGMLAGVSAEPPRDAEKTEVHVWGCNMGEPRWGWYALEDAFEKKHPHIDVIFGPTDRGEDLQKLLSGVVGNSPPDLFLREGALFGGIAARGILEPLDGFIDADRERPDGLHQDDFLPGKWEAGKFNGKLYGIAQSVNPVLMAYNRDLFRKAGLDPNAPPATWDEWIEAAEKLTIRDDVGRTLQLGTSFGGRDNLGFYITQLGGRLFSEDGRECTLDSPEGVQAVTFMKAMYTAMGGREAVDRFVASNAAPEEFNPFALGKVAMTVEDDWVIYRTMRYAPEMDFAIAPIPAPPGREHITEDSTGGLYMIPANARHKQEAWDLLRFIISAEGELIKAEAIFENARKRGQIHKYTGFRPYLPAGVALSKEYAPTRSPWREAFANGEAIAERLVAIPANPVSGFLRDELYRANDRTAYGVAAPAEAMAHADQRIQEQLDLFFQRDALPLFQWRWVWGALGLIVAAGLGFFYHQTHGERAYSALQRRENRMGLVFVSPWAFGFLVLIAGPMVFSMAMSFCDYNVIHPARFVGVRNYVTLLTHDPLMWKSLRNTAFMVLALPVGMSASLGIALLLNTKVKGMSFYRTLFYLPAITPAVATAVLWYALLNPEGLVNAGLNATICKWLPLEAPAWLQDPRWSKPAIILMGLWGAGGGMILWLAGLQGIPKQLYEAASIDGAGAFRRFWSITLPMLTPYIFFSFVVGVIGVFQIFAQALILTLGGPADSTMFYVYYLFNNAFRYFKMGYASAQAWILFVLVLILTLIQWRMSKKWVHYG